MSYIQIYYAIEKAQKELVAEAEKEGPDIRASVASMYSGNTYYLFRFKRLKDVRLVYAPPLDLGNFGAKSTTGCGLGTPAISPFYGPMWTKMETEPTSAPAISPIDRSPS